MAAEEQPLRHLALFGAAVLVIDRLQIFHLRHIERAVEALDDPSRQADMIGMRMGHDQPGDLDMGERALEQRGPGRDRSPRCRNPESTIAQPSPSASR